MLDLNTFKIVVDNTPLISIDFIIKNSDSKILLGKRVNKPAKDYLFTLGGRVYKNEKLNDAKQRILKEEVGLDVVNIRYYKSQPWPLSGSMMIGFIAEADENQPIIVDNKEITTATWFGREELPDYPSNISIAGELIEKFKNGEL